MQAIPPHNGIGVAVTFSAMNSKHNDDIIRAKPNKSKTLLDR